MSNRISLRSASLILAVCSTASAQYAITEYAGAAAPYEITAGPDGNLWFADGLNNAIGRITTSGVAT